MAAGDSSRHSEESTEGEVDPRGKVIFLRTEGLSEGSKPRGAVLGVAERKVPKVDGSARKAAFHLPGIRPPRLIPHRLEDFEMSPLSLLESKGIHKEVLNGRDIQKIMLFLLFVILGCINRNNHRESILQSPRSDLSTIQMMTILNIPKPSPGTGVVIGQLLAIDIDGKARPYLSVLYLGHILRESNDKNTAFLIYFSEETDIKGIQDPKTGYFYFYDVPPGEYGIILWTPVGSMPLYNPETQEYIIFTLKPQEIINLGTIIYK